MTKFLLFAAAAFIIWWLLKGKRPGKTAAMSAEEAARLLGVDLSADPGTIIDAHRKLIGKVHPDTGGTAELAARVNQARDVLLSRITKTET